MSGTGWYGCLYPYPTPCISTRSYAVPGHFAAGVPNLPECWGTGGYGCPNLRKGRVRVCQRLYSWYCMDVHVYNYVCVCWWRSRLAKIVPHMMSEKNPPRMKNQQSRWLYPFPWYEQDRTRVPGVPVPVPGYLNKALPGTRVFSRGCIELTKVSVMGLDVVPVPKLSKGRVHTYVVPILPKGRVRAWMFYEACQTGRVWYGYLYPYPYPVPGHFPAGAPNLSSVRYGYGCRTELTKVSGTGPNLPKCRARVWKSYQAQ